MSRHRWRAAAVIAVVLGSIGLTEGVVSADGSTTGLANPAANVPENPLASAVSSCVSQGRYQWSTSDACTQVALAGINNARALEGVKAMVLPSNWDSLTPQEQFFVAMNLERVDRGLAPYVGINAQLNVPAQAGAVAQKDPAGANGYPVGTGGWASIYGPAGVDALDTLYELMYSDGWGPTNVDTNGDCTSPSATGCWGHREAILGEYTGLDCTTCEVGVGYDTSTYYADAAAIVASTAGSPPPVVFSWSSELPYFSTPWTPTVTTSTTVPLNLTKLTASQVHGHAVILTTSALNVAWSVPTGKWSIGAAALNVYRGTGCHTLIRQGTSRYSPTANAVSGTIRVSGSGAFAPVGPFSGKVTLSYANGLVTSRCLSLGRS